MKKLVIAILFLILLAQASACTSTPVDTSAEPAKTSTPAEPSITAFRPVAFGMTKDEVKSAEANLTSLTDFGDSWLASETEIEGQPCKLYYGFNGNGELYGIGYTSDYSLIGIISDEYGEYFDDYFTSADGIRLIDHEAGARAAIPDSEEANAFVGIAAHIIEWHLEDMDITIETSSDFQAKPTLISFISTTIDSPEPVLGPVFPGLAEAKFWENKAYIKSAIEKSGANIAFAGGTDSNLGYATKILDRPAGVYYYFNNAEELDRLMYTIGSYSLDKVLHLNQIDEVDVCMDNYQVLQKELVAEYGTPTGVQKVWQNGSEADYGEDENDAALTAGDLEYKTIWELDDMTVELMLGRRSVLGSDMLMLSLMIVSSEYPGQ